MQNGKQQKQQKQTTKMMRFLVPHLVCVARDGATIYAYGSAKHLSAFQQMKKEGDVEEKEIVVCASVIRNSKRRSI